MFTSLTPTKQIPIEGQPPGDCLQRPAGWQPPLSALSSLMKRVFDVVMALVGLGLLLPLLCLTALLIKLDSPEPIFFRQERLGT
jgi:lipopolysaccharide/colanic/teichoic acid biosynthesis glycosyltransferase